MATQKDLQELVDFRSEDPPVVSLYVTVDPAAGTKEEHKLVLRGLLKAVSSEASMADVEAIERFFDFDFDWQARAVALFSCADREFWRAFHLDVPVDNASFVGRRPYVQPLSRLLNLYARYGVILVDREGARLFKFEMGSLREAVGTLGDEVKHHKQGGFAAARYQRRADEQAKHNLRDAARLAGEFYQGGQTSRLIIGGTTETASQFQAMLSKPLQDKLAGVVPIDILASETEVRDRTLDLIKEVEQARNTELVERMITAATKGGSAVLGLADVLMALQEQRIHTLVVAEGFEVSGYLCQNCNYVGAEHTGTCPICNGPMVEVDDAVDTAVRRAIEQGADVEVVQDGDEFVKAGSAGAILRY